MTDRAPKFMPEPIGIARPVASLYVGVSPGQFDTMVKEGRMPKPMREGKRKIWYTVELAAALVDLPTEDEANEWDEVLS